MLPYEFMDVAKQQSANDYVVFALALAINLVHNVDPSGIIKR